MEAKTEVVTTTPKPGGKTAKEVVAENPHITRKYLKEVETVTDRTVHPKQVKLLKEDLKANEYEKLDDAAYKRHRKEWDATVQLFVKNGQIRLGRNGRFMRGIIIMRLVQKYLDIKINHMMLII